MNVTTRRSFVIQSAMSTCALALHAGAPDASDAIRKALANHNRAVLVKTGWLRDPMIFLSKDGYFYLTGTTLTPQAEKSSSPGGKTGPGWHVRAWRSRDLVAWEDLGDLTSLKETPYYKTAHAVSSRHPNNSGMCGRLSCTSARTAAGDSSSRCRRRCALPSARH